MRFIYQFISAVLVMVVLLVSCSPENADNRVPEEEGPLQSAPEGDHGDSGKEGIQLTRKQVKTMNITLGDFSRIKINDFVSATGTLGIPPNALTSVNAKSSGFIKNSNKYVEGSYVQQGAILGYLENPDFIQQQKEYLEIAAGLVFDRQELARQLTLVNADAGIEKTVQKLQSEINVKTATLKGIEKQLAYLGIRVDDLTIENITERVPLYAPVAGYITSIKMHNGLYVVPEIQLMEIMNEHQIHLELDVFEKDIAQVKENQPISYTVPALGNTVYEGEVQVIGKAFNIQNKTVRVYGSLGKERPRFIKDLFVEAKIWLNDQTVQALPEKAVVQDGATAYIYVTNDQVAGEALSFEPIRVITGLTEQGFTAVKLIDEISENVRIVTDGAYFVYAQSKSGELTED